MINKQSPFWFHVEPVLSIIRRFDAQVAIADARTAIYSPAAFPGAGRRDEVTEVTGFNQPLSWGNTATAELPEGSSEGLDIVMLRGELREGLKRLERRLAQDLREPHIRNIMLPLVILGDERMMTATQGRAAAWAPLQLELFGFDDGGVQFYTKLEELISLPDTPTTVFEVYYYCLRDGFLGLYADNPARIEDYRERLEKRLVVETDELAREEPEVAHVELVEFPFRYYAWSAASVLSLVLILFGAGWLHGG